MTRIMLITGTCSLVLGLVELAWSIRAPTRRVFALQGMIFVELGTMFIANQIIPDGPVGVAVAALLGLCVLATFIVMIRLVRREQRARA